MVSRTAYMALKDFVTIAPEKAQEEKPQEDQFEEIWRPKRQQFSRPGQQSAQGRQGARKRPQNKQEQGGKKLYYAKGRKAQDRNARGPKPDGGGGQQGRPRPKPRRADPDSPFAALGNLKKQLEQKKK